MKTEVLLERLPDKRYRAKGSGPFALTVNGDTREDALNNFREAAVALVPKDAEIVEIDIPIRSGALKDDPWVSFAGWLKDDPLLPLYLEAIKENRRIDEENENRKMTKSESRPEDALAQFAGIAVGNPLYSMFLEQMQRNREADESEEEGRIKNDWRRNDRDPEDSAS